MPSRGNQSKKLKLVGLPNDEILRDYRIGFMSRAASLIGRKEVLGGKAKFGIFGDGKEVAQLAMARAFKHGDWRSGYYRDQTFMLAIGATDIGKFFAQLYADTNVDNEPASGGRQMNSHFATRYLDDRGNWLNQLMMHNTTADASPTACQMPRLLGIGYASKIYRENQDIDQTKFSISGNEIGFGTIGNASTSEGLFWETLNAAGVLQVPVLVSVWDDGYGISVPNKYQTTKQSISEACSGFQSTKNSSGFEIYVVKGWDYSKLVEVYANAAEKIRKTHVPALIHVIEMTQPQGHSTSGSHERYKSDERLEFEKSHDCLAKMREWIISEKIATKAELDKMEEEVQAEVVKEQRAAWESYLEPIREERNELIQILNEIPTDAEESKFIETAVKKLNKGFPLNRRLILSTARQVLIDLRHNETDEKDRLINFSHEYHMQNNERYNSHLLSESERSPVIVDHVPPEFVEESETVDGREVIRRIFDHHLENDPRMFIIGEDVGKLGGVNLEFDGLQDKHGENRVTDTGIREATILGQGIGAAVRGLRPIVDIQYLDYLLYAFQIMSDDLATLHYRTAGGQIAPVIVRTKGDRLEGVWHTGSPMGTIINGIRGMHVCVPRDMVQAAGMYNTLLKGDDPALVVEVLNGYRLKERVPENLTSFQVPLGIPEVLSEGHDLTVVTYGACVKIVQSALEELKKVNISVELIDVRTLLPFDIRGVIIDSLRKTGAILFMDEDVPGGASAFMLQQVIEEQGGYDFLDAMPRTLSSQPHRGAYASDGDYFSKPNSDDVFDYCYSIMQERNPEKYPRLR